MGAALAGQRGLPALPIARIAHPVGAATASGVEAKADAALAAVVAGFTTPVADRQAGRTGAPAIVEVPDTPAEAMEFFFDAGWTDGLPVVPPLPSLVAAAVAATGRDPEALVAVLPPLEGRATVAKIAANAVMAGCLPEYLPVVVAAIEALADPAYGLYHRQITTHAGAPLMIVNGPIARRVGINSRTGVFGPGWRANATIGRAVRLILMNLGGAIPGVTDMSQHGHPGKFSFCIAEDEESNPWEPLHVERGFRTEQSVVTMVNAEAPHSMTDNFATHAREILTTCASTLSALGSNNLYSQGEPVLALGPEHAAYIAADGWSKSDVKLFIYDKARQPWRLVTGRGKSLGPKFPKWLDRPEPDDMVPILSHPDELIVVCCGGAGGKSMGIPTAGRMSRAVSRAIAETEDRGGN